MGGLLWSRVCAGELNLSPGLSESLARENLFTRARHRRLWNGLRSIGRRLGDIGVDVALVKGVADERRWYEREGERPCVDLDLLVNPAQTHRVAEVVALLDPAHGLRDDIESLYARGLLQSIDLQVDGVAVDLHLDLFKLGVRCRQPDLLWAHTMPGPFPDTGTVRLLQPELALVNFLLHLNRNSFCWLLGFADVVRLLDRATIDWVVVDELVRAEGVDVPVHGSLRAVTETLGVPCRGLRSLRGPRPWLWRVLWRTSVRLQGDVGWIRFRHRLHWLPFLLDGRLPEALRCMRAQLLLAPALIDHVSPGRGPWPWRLLTGRFRRAGQRRHAIARLRKAR